MKKEIKPGDKVFIIRYGINSKEIIIETVKGVKFNKKTKKIECYFNEKGFEFNTKDIFLTYDKAIGYIKK